jgi:integrase
MVDKRERTTPSDPIFSSADQPLVSKCLGQFGTGLDNNRLLPVALPRMGRRFTQISIKKIKPDPTRRLELPDSQVVGLFLIIQPSGKRSWAVRYRLGGKTRKLTLDAFYSLAVARKRARAVLDEVAEGRDPAAEKRARKFFGDVARDFLEMHVKVNCRKSYAHDAERMLKKDVLPSWGGRRISDIRRSDVIDLLDRIIERGGGITANRVLAVVASLFNWAIDRGVIEASPSFHVRKPIAETPRDRVLTDQELAALWRACGLVPYPHGPFTKILLLTAQRRSEVAGMRWSEIEGAEWVLPGQRTKNGRAHAVPLSAAAQAVLDSIPRIEGDFVFTITGKAPIMGFSEAKAAIDEHMPPIPRWVFHDLRRTAATGMARLGVTLPTVERLLNHASGSFADVAGVYQRYSFSEEKRQALELWASFVTKNVN